MDSKYGRIIVEIVKKIIDWFDHRHIGSCTDYFPVEICRGFEAVAESIAHLAEAIYNLFWNFIALWR